MTLKNLDECLWIYDCLVLYPLESERAERDRLLNCADAIMVELIHNGAILDPWC